MIESRRQTGQWRRIAPPPGSTQSTSRLFCAAESEINRIVTLGAVPGRTLPRSKPERSPRLLNEVSTGIEYRLPPGSCRVRRWPVNYRKLTDHARQTGKRLGRPATATLHASRMCELYHAGVCKAEIARRLRIGRTSVRGILKAKR